MTTVISNTLSMKRIPIQVNWVKDRFVRRVSDLRSGDLHIGSNYFDVFPTNKNLTYNLVTSAVFLVAALLLKHSERWNQYWWSRMPFSWHRWLTRPHCSPSIGSTG